MKIARSTYYHTPVRDERQLASDLELKDKIEKIHLEFPAYGYRRVYHHLLRQGSRINTKRIKRVMQKYELYTCLKKWMKPRGTRTTLKLRYPNLIKGMKLTAPNKVWATDITYISLLEDFVYLSAVIDVYTRKIVGWSISQSLDHTFCLKSLEVAIKREEPPQGVIHHSDRGVQYVCEPYVKFLLDHGLVLKFPCQRLERLRTMRLSSHSLKP